MKRYLLILSLLVTAFASAQQYPRRYLGLDTTFDIPKVFTDTVYPLSHSDSDYLDGNGNFVNRYDSIPKIFSMTNTGRPPATYNNVTGAFRVPANGSLFGVCGAGPTNFTTTIPGIAAYDSGMVVNILFNNGNTGAATLNINGLGAVTLKKNASSNLVTGDIPAGQWVQLMYDGTFFQAQRYTISSAGYASLAGNLFTGANTMSPISLYTSGNIATHSTIVSANLASWSTTAMAAVTSNQYYYVDGTTPVFTRISIGGYIMGGSITTNNNAANLLLTRSGFQTVSARTYPLVSNLMVLTPRDSVASTITDFQCIYAGDAPTTGVNNYSINAGASKFRSSVAIGGTAPANAAAILDLTSTTKGLLLPRMTKTQRDAIASPVAGLAVYQTDNTPGLRVYNGTNWMRYTETAD